MGNEWRINDDDRQCGRLSAGDRMGKIFYYYPKPLLPDCGKEKMTRAELVKYYLTRWRFFQRRRQRTLERKRSFYLWSGIILKGGGYEKG